MGDKKVKGRVEAKNALENYLYSMKNTVEDKKKAGDKISEDDKKTILDAVEEGIKWNDGNLRPMRRHTSRRRLKKFATLSFPSCTRVLEDHPGVMLVPVVL